MTLTQPVSALVRTPFHVAAFVFVVVGFSFAVYLGLQALGAVPRVAWVGWSHIHFVTVGAFTQLLLGMLPQVAARRLGVSAPTSAVVWTSFLGLNVGFVAAWIGRAFGPTWAYDAGLVLVWLTVLGVVGVLVAQLVRAARRDLTAVMYVASPVVFLIGLTFAFALYTETFAFEVPGGWWGLREGHVHANAWGFLGLAAIATISDVLPRLVRAPLHSHRLRNVSFALLLAGILPLSIGPVLGLGRSVTGTGLALFGAGYVAYVVNLVRTYRAGQRSPLALWLLVAQAWILGPAGFAPFILFGVPLGIPEPWIETGALHFFFMGWALPVALVGLAIFLRNLPSRDSTATVAAPADLLPRGIVPGSIVSHWMIWAWNGGVLVVAISFFLRDAAWSPAALGIGSAVLVGLWAHHLVRIAQQWRLATAGA